VYNYNPKISGPVSACTFYQVGKISDMCHVDLITEDCVVTKAPKSQKSKFYFCSSPAILFSRSLVECAEIL